jgi:hypothetical protein
MKAPFDLNTITDPMSGEVQRFVKRLEGDIISM